MRRRGLSVAGAALAILATACSRGIPGQGPVVLSVDGVAIVTEAGGEPFEVRGERRVALGAVVEVREGTARAELPDDARVHLRAGRDGLADGRVELGSVPELLAGALLAESTGPVSVRAAGSSIDLLGGAVKVTRDLAVTAQVYEGAATLVSAGRALPIPALRQASLPSVGLVPDEPSPLALDPADPWDVQFLGEAIDLNDRLDARARGFTASLAPGEGTTPGFFRVVLPALRAERGFTPALVEPARPAGETLVGAVITAVADGSAPASFGDRWREVFSFRDAGAGWGLVVLDQAAERAAVIDQLDQAVDRAPIVTVGEPPSATRPSSTSPGEGPTTTTRGGPSTSAPTTSTSGPPPPPSSTTTTLLPPLPDIGGDDAGLLDGLLSGSSGGLLGGGGGGGLLGVLGAVAVPARRSRRYG